MAAPALGTERRQKTTYGNRARTKLPEDSDIFGVPRSPSPAAPKSRAQPTKSASHARSGQMLSSRQNGQRALATATKASTATRHDIFDLLASDDEDLTIRKPAIGGKRVQLKNEIKANRATVPVKKEATTINRIKRAAPTNISSKRLKDAGQASSAGLAQDKKGKAAVSNLFDFPDSSDERPSESAVIFSSKVDFRNKTSNATKRIKPVEVAAKRPAKALAPSAIQDAAPRKPIEQQRTERQASRGPTVTSQPTNLSLPHRQPRTTNTKSNDASRPAKRPANTTSKRKVVATGSSAPAILSKMIPQEAKSPVEIPMLSPVSNSPAPPFKESDSLRTPSPEFSASPRRQPRAMTQTPKQKALWGKLLDDTLIEMDSPSELPVAELSINTAKKRPNLVVERSSSDVTAAVPRKRVKLINTLKRTAAATEEDEDSDRPSESESELESESESDTEARPSDEAIVEQVQKSKHPGPSAPTKITYSQQRSYLVEQTEEDMLDMMIEEMSQPMNKSLQPSQKDGFDLESDNDDADEGGQPKSAHDLRAAGSKKRMLQDLENLISGLENDTLGPSSKRADLMEVTNSLFNISTVELILDHGMDRQLVASFTKSKDAVFNFIATCCLGLIVKGTKQLAVLRGFSRAGSIDKLFDLFSNTKSIAELVKERCSNMSGIAQRKVLALKDSIVASDLWSGVVPVSMSPQLAALRLLELIVRRMRELGGDDMPMDEDRLLEVLEILQNNESSKDNAIYAWLTFSILESTSAGYYTSKRGPWTAKAFKDLAKRLAWLLDQPKQEFRPARRLALALSMNLTNNNPKACDALSKPDVLPVVLETIAQGFTHIASSDADAEQDDELILCLGTMINMAELSESARLCVLSAGSDALNTLVSLFFARLDHVADATSIESSRHNVPFGYLALLFVNLCQTDALRTEVLRLLKGTAQLTGLIGAAEEFIVIHQQTDREMAAGGEEDEKQISAHADYTRRLMGMVERLKDVAR